MLFLKPLYFVCGPESIIATVLIMFDDTVV